MDKLKTDTENKCDKLKVRIYSKYFIKREVFFRNAMVLLLNNGFGIFVMGWGIAYEDALKRPSENQRFVLLHKQSKVTITL